MITADIHLTEEQRQQVLDLLGRRFRKMPDQALMELESLTRHPVDLAGFQARISDVIVANKQIAKSKTISSDDVIDGIVSHPISRREFLAYSASGLLGLLFFGTGYGWWQSTEEAQQLAATVSDANMDVDSLEQSLTNIQAAITDCRKAILEFQNTYPQTILSIAELRNNKDWVRNISNEISQTGMSITEIIEFVLNWLTLIPEAARFAQPISTMLDLVKNTPEIIFSIEQVLTNLELWFSEQNNQGIDRKLLFPAELVFDTIDNDIKLRLRSLHNRLANS